jgi:hypothetical protein
MLARLVSSKDRSASFIVSEQGLEFGPQYNISFQQKLGLFFFSS